MAEDLSLIDKYAVKYYLPTLSQLLALYLLYASNDPLLYLAYNGFVLVIGYYFSTKDTINTNNSKEQNKQRWAEIPLIINCLATPTILFILWQTYDQFVQGSFGNGFALAFGATLSIGGSIDASHQLIHRDSMICKVVSYFNLYFFEFTAYPIEHLYLHHKKVGTPEDPITAAKNSNIYSYAVNAIFSAYKFNYSYNKTYFLGCFMATLSHIALVVGFCLKQGSGIGKMAFFIGICYMSLLLLETVQYCQHYGLIYRSSEKAKPVTEICSWNTSQNSLLNCLIFRFERHSDHHMNAYKLYHTLDLTSKMPQFPFDFISANFICLIPPLWHYIANPLVDQVIQNKTLDKQHVINSKRIMNTFRILVIFIFTLRFVPWVLAY